MLGWSLQQVKAEPRAVRIYFVTGRVDWSQFVVTDGYQYQWWIPMGVNTDGRYRYRWEYREILVPILINSDGDRR
jgi:hypothetical protein